ncbi:MAG TPA: hypothetical protein VLN49_07415 [Gemmatimonadaceae bacterium]|nr:hypothetical protein [Gemmatimonadaceae bacterium]
MRCSHVDLIVALATLLELAGTATAGSQVSDEPTWKLSGYYLNLYTQSRTVVPAPESFTLDLNRLRLRLEGKPTASVGLDVQYDNEALLGSYIRTTQFTLTDARIATSLDLTHDYATRGDLVARHGLYRAVLSWSGGNTDVKLGRQRIPIGTGYFWSPMDMLNPIDPTRLERDYRVGADGLLIQQKLGAVARVEGIYVPATARLSSVGAGYLHGNLRGTDYSLLVGRFRGDDAIGIDVSTSRGGLGIRGEATATRAPEDTRYARVLVGADYGFANSATVTVEGYYNGQGTSDAVHYDVAGVLAGRVLNVARWYGGVGASYQVTPLVKASVYGVLNADDRSGVVWPRVEWSARSDVDLVAGFQRFVGGAGTEYGRMSNLLHAEVRLFF